MQLDGGGGAAPVVATEAQQRPQRPAPAQKGRPNYGSRGGGVGTDNDHHGVCANFAAGSAPRGLRAQTAAAAAAAAAEATDFICATLASVQQLRFAQRSVRPATAAEHPQEDHDGRDFHTKTAPLPNLWAAHYHVRVRM